jgi:hypothetical protein
MVEGLWYGGVGVGYRGTRLWYRALGYSGEGTKPWYRDCGLGVWGWVIGVHGYGIRGLGARVWYRVMGKCGQWASVTQSPCPGVSAAQI